MTRETRLNLLFLAAFLVVSAPGAVILFKKRLDPTSPRMSLPDAIRHQVPYMAPGPIGPQDRRVVPPLTGQWLAAVARERAAGGVLLVRPESPGGYLPAISDDGRVEVVARGTTATADPTIDLVLWDPAGLPDPITVSASTGGREVPGNVADAQGLMVPATVRRELRDLGFVDAPATVRWVRVTFPTMRDPIVLAVRSGRAPNAPRPSTVNLFTNAVP